MVKRVRGDGLKHQKEKRSMDHFAGLDVSVKETSVCILDDAGRIVKEVKGAGQPLGGVDSKDSLLGANQIQGFFFGGSLGCDGSFGVERCRMGANGAADHRAACALDRAYRFSLAWPS